MSMLFNKIFRRTASKAQMPDRDEFIAMANSPEVAAYTDKMLAQIPVDDHFESFAALRSQQDEHGIVRLKD